MSKRFTNKITLNCSTAEIKTIMISFFERYQNELPMFLKEQLEQLKIDSDPAMIIKKDVIEINRVTLDKGIVFTEKKGVITLGDYKLVGDNEKYIKFMDGRIFIFFKRNGTTPDTQVGVFENFDMVSIGFKNIEDPHVVALRIAEKVADDASEIGENVDNITEDVKMEVVK